MTEKKKRPYRIINRTGETNINKKGSYMTIVKTIDSENIIVKFKDGFETTTTYANFKKGLVKNPFDKTIYGVGYIGIDNYDKYKNNIKNTKAYSVWRDMIYRVYGNSKKSLNYKDCQVCKEWHSFKNFLKWYDYNYYYLPNEKVHLDKDILYYDNKIYSPENCVFVPQSINQIFEKHKENNRKLPVGIHKAFGKYYGKSRDQKTDFYINIEDAIIAYKNLKINKAQNILSEYKKYIPDNIYNKIMKGIQKYEFR